MANGDPGAGAPQTGDQGWLPALLDVVLNSMGAGGAQPDETGEFDDLVSPRSAYDLFTGGPDAPTHFGGFGHAGVIYPPGPIHPSKTDQGLGLLAAVLANQYNKRKKGQGGTDLFDMLAQIGDAVQGLGGSNTAGLFGGVTTGGSDMGPAPK
jgi:hypothetical protein